MKKNKVFKVLSSTALVAALAAPVVGTVVTPAPVYAAAGSIQKIGTPIVAQADNQQLGTLKIVIPAGSSTDGETLTISLSDGELSSAFSTSDSTQANSLSVDLGDNTAGSVNFSLAPGTGRDGDDKIKLVADNDIPVTDDVTLYVKLNDVDFSDADDSEIKMNVTASPASGFPTGEVAAANASDDDQVSLTTSGLETSNESFEFDLNVTEKKPGAITDKDNANPSEIELKLPAGYEFDGDQTITAETAYGDQFTARVDANEERAFITFDRPGTKLSAFKIKDIKFSLVDDEKAKDGEIKASVDAENLDLDVSDLTVGTQGEFGVKVSAKEPEKTLIAGKTEQEISDVTIQEVIAGTLVEDRTITLTLPEGAKWVQADNSANDEADLTLKGFEFGDKTLKYTVTDASTDESENVLKNLEVAISPDFQGDLEAEIGGTSGVTGKVKLGKVAKAITVAAAEEVPTIGIGRTSIEAADFTIKENVKEAFESDSNTTDDSVSLELPAGVYFDGTPTIEVTEGDLRISNVKVDGDDKRYVTFDVDAESIKPSTIKVSNVKLKVYRDVPEGDITLKVTGGGVVETTHDDLWPNVETAGALTIAKVGTPAPTDTTASNIVFKLNSKTFTVDGKELTMDAAPLVGWDRAYLPVRFAANALNVQDEQIIWDDKTSTFTVFKGDRVVSGKVGDKFLTVNGAKVPMDVPVWRNKAQTNNRVMVPIRYLANALNADIQWNKETSEITIEAAK